MGLKRDCNKITRQKVGLFFNARSKGLEPSTSRVTGECSNQLSYDRKQIYFTQMATFYNNLC
jgi:hypothetical protein